MSLPVQFIACTNNAGFVMTFQIEYTLDGSNWVALKWSSDKYPIDQTRTSPDLASVGLPTGAQAVRPLVHAVLGKTNSGSPDVSYAANGQTGTYEVKGTTLDYSVKLISGG